MSSIRHSSIYGSNIAALGKISVKVLVLCESIIRHGYLSAVFWRLLQICSALYRVTQARKWSKLSFGAVILDTVQPCNKTAYTASRLSKPQY